MECIDGCTSPFDQDLCIRCLYNRIIQLLDEQPELAKRRACTDTKRYGYRLYLRLDEAADSAFDRLDRDQMQHILGLAQREEVKQ